MMPLERQPSDDFVLHTPEGRTLYSNNDTTNNHFVLLPSPNSKRRELRRPEGADGGGPCGAEQPRIERRERQPAGDGRFCPPPRLAKVEADGDPRLKELSDDDRVALEGLFAAAAMEEAADGDAKAPDDEVGIHVLPAQPVRRPSYKNGRRVSEPNLTVSPASPTTASRWPGSRPTRRRTCSTRSASAAFRKERSVQ